MKDETRETLLLFIEQAERLMASRFVRTIMEARGTKLTIHFRGEDDKSEATWLEVERTGPDGEAVEAFVLTFRQFFQKNERYSFKSLAQRRFLDSAKLSDKWKQLFTQEWADLQDFLNSPTEFILDGEAPTHWRVIEVFIYGGLAHTTPDKRVVFEAWRNDRLSYELLLHSFINSMNMVLKGIWDVRQFIAEELGLPPGKLPFRPRPKHAASDDQRVVN